MMKYATNHYKSFSNPLMPFFTGFLSTVISLIIEFNVMVVLSSLPDLLGIIVRYVSLASIAKVPGIYF
jgi:heme O synthase-like polyprenyltransferase